MILLTKNLPAFPEDFLCMHFIFTLPVPCFASVKHPVALFEASRSHAPCSLIRIRTMDTIIFTL